VTKRKQPELSALRQPASAPLLDDTRRLIVDTCVWIAATVHAGLTLLYWQIGQRICKDVLQEKRVEYGEEIVPTLSAQFVLAFGEGFRSRNLAQMLQGDFAFLTRQKRIVNEDWYLDLLFYYRRLRRMVAIEQQRGKCTPADVGHMEFYLRWLMSRLRERRVPCNDGRKLRRHRPFYPTYPYIRESLPPAFTQVFSRTQEHVDRRETLTPTSLRTGVDILRKFSFTPRPYPECKDSDVLLRGCCNKSYSRAAHEKSTCTGACRCARHTDLDDATGNGRPGCGASRGIRAGYTHSYRRIANRGYSMAAGVI